jgi:hypothetical protein
MLHFFAIEACSTATNRLVEVASQRKTSPHVKARLITIAVAKHAWRAATHLARDVESELEPNVRWDLEVPM